MKTVPYLDLFCMYWFHNKLILFIHQLYLLVPNYIQIGSRITSKRVSQMVEECFPCTYILVDNHPCRHDPSHFVTHRVQCSIHQFADSLMKAQFSHRNSKWCCFLRVLNTMVFDLTLWCYFSNLNFLVILVFWQFDDHVSWWCHCQHKQIL